MVNSLEALLDRAIDYAGLFPPAALPLEEAVAEFSELLAGPNAWMVNRFVCPVAWLDDFSRLLPKEVSEPWPITVLGTSVEGFRQDLNLIERFEELGGERVSVEGYEVKAQKSEMTDGLLNRIEDADFDEAYIEIPWRTELAEFLHPLVDHDGLGAKARTGGLEADKFPTSEEVADFIHECVSLDVPFKLTAGLHHPFPRFDQEIGARMHGFLNILVATAFAGPLDLSRAELVQIIAEDDPSKFVFHDAGVRFGQWGLNLDELNFGRLMFSSWGSCSVQEPIDDLTAAKLFP